MQYWLHVGNILYLFAYSVRDILWLRVLTVVATLCLLPYYYCCSAKPLYEPIAWCSLFTLVNLVQIGLLIWERRPVFLGEEELRLYRSVFHTLSPRQYMKLLSIADWKRVGAGQTILKQDEPVAELLLISSGSGSVQVDGRQVAEIGPRQFVGEMAFLTQRAASASVIAGEPLDILCWPVDKLRDLFAEASQIHFKVQAILGVDLVEKLRHEGAATIRASAVIPPEQEEGLV